MDVIDSLARSVLPSNFVANELEVCFHAGEPLAVGIEWYRDALGRFEPQIPQFKSVSYSIQTNGTLLSSQWTELFIEYSIRPSVSLDGPVELNDRYRKRRDGSGTHEQTLRGIRILQEDEIPFSILCVLTAESLHHPDALFEYFTSLAPDSVSFNVEEIEGVNLESSVSSSRELEACRVFFARFYDLVDKVDPPFTVREFEQPNGLLSHRLRGREVHNSLVKPLCYLSIAYDGSISTFSPELLTMRHTQFGDFVIGNILSDTLEEVAASPKLKEILSEVEIGNQNCRQECSYFEFCGGGSPSNKLAELGTFTGTETWWCRTSIQILLDLAVQRMRKKKSQRL